MECGECEGERGKGWVCGGGGESRIRGHGVGGG